MYHVTFKNVTYYLNVFYDCVAIEADVTDLHVFVCFFSYIVIRPKNMIFIMLDSSLQN